MYYIPQSKNIYNLNMILIPFKPCTNYAVETLSTMQNTDCDSNIEKYVGYSLD